MVLTLKSTNMDKTYLYNNRVHGQNADSLEKGSQKKTCLQKCIPFSHEYHDLWIYGNFWLHKKIDLMFGGPGTTGTTTHFLKSTATTGWCIGQGELYFSNYKKNFSLWNQGSCLGRIVVPQCNGLRERPRRRLQQVNRSLLLNMVGRLIIRIVKW